MRIVSRRGVSRGHAAALVGAIAAALAIGLLVFRRSPSTGAPTARGLALAETAANRFEDCDAAPLTDGEAVVAGLLRGTITTEPGIDAASFFQHLVSFLTARASGDVNDYIAWAQREGLVLDEDAWPAERRAQVAPILGLGGVPVSEISLSEVFRRFWKRRRDHVGDVDLPRRIAIGPDCVYARFARQSDTARIPPISTHDAPGASVWIGEIAYGQAIFWQAPVTAEQVLVRDGSLITASAYLAIQGPTGEWLPVSAAGYFDPAAQAWRITKFTFINTYAVNSGPVI